MDMKPVAIIVIALGALLALVGCSTAGTTSGGTGAEAGPWPTAPTQPSSSRPATDETPNAPLMVLLRAAAPEDTQLRLAVTQIEFKVVEKNTERWVTVVKKDDVAKNEPAPLLFGAKGGTALLANVQVPRRKYTAVRVTLEDGKAALLKEKKESKLTVKLPQFPLPEWTPDDKLPNLLTLKLDIGKLVKATDTAPATLPAEAFSLTHGVATCILTGKVQPALPNAKVELFWGASKTALRTVAPTADGTFSVSDLPEGKYRIDVRANGYALQNPPKELLNVTADKPLALDPLTLGATPTTAT